MYTETDNIDAALAKLKLLSNDIVITLGDKVALVANAEQHIQVAGRKVTAVDTNGAGDAFAGAFLYALNSGEDIQTAAELAILISR